MESLASFRDITLLDHYRVDVVPLLVSTQRAVHLRVDHLSDGIGDITADECLFNHVIRTGVLDDDRCPVDALVRNILEGSPLESVVKATAYRHRLSFLIGIGKVADTVATSVLSLIVDGLGSGVELRSERCAAGILRGGRRHGAARHVAVVLHLVAVAATIGRIDEEVESVIVITELRAVFVSQRTPCLQGTVRLAGLEEGTAIESFLRAVVGIVEIVLQILVQLGIGPRGVGSLQGLLQAIHLGDRQQTASKDRIATWHLQRGSTYRRLRKACRQGSPLSSRIGRLNHRRSRIEMLLGTCLVRGAQLLGNDVSLFNHGLVVTASDERGRIVIDDMLGDDLTMIVFTLAIDTARQRRVGRTDDIALLLFIVQCIVGI